MTGITTQEEGAGRPYDQFILFGDSITEMSSDQSLGFAFGAGLQHGMFSHCNGPRWYWFNTADLLNSL
jgi:hypothetical protein